jgi:hypothetical protein
MIMAVWMFPATSGCRAMLSTAQEPILPIPMPAPMMIKPAPKAPPSQIEKPLEVAASVPVWAIAGAAVNSSNRQLKAAIFVNLFT